MHKTCRVCSKAVSPSTGLQHDGKCGEWTHFRCLKYTTQLLDVRSGLIRSISPCSDCFSKPTKQDHEPEDATTKNEVQAIIADVIRTHQVNYQYESPKRRLADCACSAQTQTDQCLRHPPKRILGSYQIEKRLEQKHRDQECQCKVPKKKLRTTGQGQDCQDYMVDKRSESSNDVSHKNCCESKQSSSDSNTCRRQTPTRKTNKPKKETVEEMSTRVGELSKQVDEIMVKLLKMIQKKRENQVEKST